MSVEGEQVGPVLLFDGTCGLCNRCVRLLLRLDRAGRLHYAPLQSPAGQAFLVQHGLPTTDFDSLILVPDWERRERPDFQSRTDGVVAALQVCGGLAWGAGRLLAIVPSRWRDAGYKLVARWRYRIWGEWFPRPLARREWEARFLDG